MKAKIPFLFAVHHIAQALLHAVVVVKGQHHGLAAVKVLRAIHIFVSADNDLIAPLAGTGRCTVKNATPRARFAINNLG